MRTDRSARPTSPITRALLRVLPFVILLQGCAVFEPIGSFFAQGYRNTVAYFNAYYNASRLFDEAEVEYLKAERTYQQSVQDGATTPFRPPQTAVQKFNAVIDKCSNILTFQAESDYVQDALFLIARSYDYQGEHVKAERKYAELLAQYPVSSYRVEAVARLGGVLLRQDRRDEALVLLEQAEQEATEKGDDAILPYILEQLAIVHRDAGEYDLAYAYYTRLYELSSEDERLVAPLIDYARLRIENGRPADGLQISQGVTDLTDDPFYLFEARTLEVRALQDLGRDGDALERLQETLDDYRFLQQQGAVRLLRAEVLHDMGRSDEAIAEYTYIDTAFVRRPPAAVAAFALGEYHLAGGDYIMARGAFERAASVAASPIVTDARRKSAATTRYIGLQQRFWQADSALTALRDSVGTDPDPRVDSMRTLLGSVMQDMGDWHFADGNSSDSAHYWLSRSVVIGARRPAQARALFILADLVNSHPDAGWGDADSCYRRINEEFPDSPYAVEARRRLGVEEVVGDDPGFGLYREAEKALQKDDIRKAAGIFDSISRTYPSSPYSVRGLFAAGWVYDHMLAEMDSAMHRYDAVVQSGTTGPHAQEARSRLTKIRSVLADTAKTSAVQPDSTARTTLPSEEGRQRQTPPESDTKIQ